MNPGLAAMAILNVVLGDASSSERVTLGRYETLEHPLVLEGFHRVEVDSGIYELSPRTPRTRYG